MSEAGGGPMTAKQEEMLETLKWDHLGPASAWLWASVHWSVECPSGQPLMAWGSLT